MKRKRQSLPTITWLAAFAVLTAVLLTGCGAQTPSPSTGSGGEPTPTQATSSSLGPTELKYTLLRKYAGNNNLLYCDPDSFPLQVSQEEEQNRANAKVPEIQADKEKYGAILRNNNLDSTAPLSSDQRLLVYRESKKLDAVSLEPSGDKYSFTLNAGKSANGNGGGAGTKYTGLIDSSGNITDEKQEDVVVRCPICLAGDTLIETPKGAVRVRDMRTGMPVWTLDKQGNRVQTIIEKTIKREIPVPYEMLHIVLSDGRELYVAPRHPLVDGRLAGDLEVGSAIDNARVYEARRVPYDEGATYDILPSGDTGFYWANGILLASTLTPTPPGQR